jgi:hypothetical protein
MKHHLSRLTYANVVSTLALLFALTGAGAYAANQLAPRSVGERQLRHGAVTASKLRKNAVIAPKIKALAVEEGKIAAGAVSGSKLANAAVSSPKLATGAVTEEKIADNAVSGPQVDEGGLSQVPGAARADFAVTAESANPAAFAAVDQEGNVDTSLSKGIGQGGVRQGAEGGIYCISVPSFSPRGAQVTLRYNGSGGSSAYVTIGGTGSCPAPQVEVQTFNGGARVKEPFYVVLYR